MSLLVVTKSEMNSPAFSTTMRRSEIEAVSELTLLPPPLLVKWTADSFEAYFIWLRALLFGGVDNSYQMAGLLNAVE